MMTILFGRFEVGTPKHAVVLSANVSPMIHGPAEFLESLRKSCTEWLLTEEGTRAREYAGSDFNVGDLAGYWDDPLFVRICQENGIHNLVISDFDSVVSYDAPLSNL